MIWRARFMASVTNLNLCTTSSEVVQARVDEHCAFQHRLVWMPMSGINVHSTIRGPA